jgi:hypothetical protein
MYSLGKEYFHQVNKAVNEFFKRKRVRKAQRLARRITRRNAK